MADSIAPRQTDIVEMARQSGRVWVDALAEHFGVTPQTIRKDLNEICEKGILQRVHGGAMVVSGVANYGYEGRRALAADEKHRIGVKAGTLIPDNSSLFINIGTTTEQVANALLGKRNLLVITNNINVVNILRMSSEIELIVAGGMLRRSDGGIVGEAAVDFIRQFKVDNAVIGTSAIDRDGSLLDYDYREVKVAQAIIENARNTVLVADSMKYERTAPVRIGHVSQLDHFVTDQAPPEELAQVCSDSGLRIHLAEATESTDTITSDDAMPLDGDTEE